LTVSFNRTSAYFIDSLTGRSESTKAAYDKDLQQFKLYLARYRPHTLCQGTPDDLRELDAELKKARGRLTDTRYASRKSKTEIRSQAILDQCDIDLSKVRKEDIVGYFGYLESTKRLTRSTLLRRLASLRRFFTLLTKEKYAIAPELLEKLTDLNIRRDRKLPIALEYDEALAFLSQITDPRDRAIVIVMLYMGLRISEVVQLNATDILPGTEGITIRGKGGKERYIPVHETVLEAVMAYKAVRLDPLPDELGEPLFVSKHRRRIHPSTVRKLIKRYAGAAETLDNRKRKRMSPHKLRHTFATLLLQGDVDIRYIQELLGHENLSTTQIYTSVNRADLSQAIDRHPLGRSR